MADESGEKKLPQQEMVTTGEDGGWEMDVAAFAPRPEGHVTVRKIRYPIYGFLDIPVDDSVKVARLGDDVKDAEGYGQRMERSIEQVMILNCPRDPETGLPLYKGAILAREHFKGMSPKQIVTLTVLASSIAKVPLKAAAEEQPSSSASPSPASAASTAGGERTSSA